MSKKVVIETDECIGCESCVEIAPEAFAFDSDSGKAYVIKEEITDEGPVQESIEACPAQCIHWE